MNSSECPRSSKSALLTCPSRPATDAPVRRFAADDAPHGGRHERGAHVVARDVRHDDAKVIVLDPVVEQVAADVPRGPAVAGHLERADAAAAPPAAG